MPSYDLKKMITQAAEEVCTYRCKWSIVCQDVNTLHERHCIRCGMMKLMELVKEGGYCDEERA